MEVCNSPVFTDIAKLPPPHNQLFRELEKLASNASTLGTWNNKEICSLWDIGLFIYNLALCNRVADELVDLNYFSWNNKDGKFKRTCGW